jgi:hypothetical protein
VECRKTEAVRLMERIWQRLGAQILFFCNGVCEVANRRSQSVAKVEIATPQ